MHLIHSDSKTEPEIWKKEEDEKLDKEEEKNSWKKEGIDEEENSDSK